MNSPPDDRVILQVESLTIDFTTHEGTTRAVEDVSFSVSRGETLGIVGESGSGKSVTSLAIMGLLPKPEARLTSGKILFHDDGNSPVALTGLTDYAMQQWRGNRIAMIFQEPMTSLNPAYRCGRQVMENILNHEKISRSEARKRTLDLFREVMLPRRESMFRAYPHQLSGGQKQRVMIAMAIACKPDILIADEPTTALDVTVQQSILELLGKLQEKYGMSLLFISHDLGVVAQNADRLLVMYRGRIVEQGNAADIFSDPQHVYTRGLLACRPPSGIRPQKLATVSDFMGGKASDPFTGVETPGERREKHAFLYSREPVLHTSDLVTRFVTRRSFFGKPRATLEAVNKVTLSVFPGETLGLAGESGCGKTTLGRTLLRLADAHSGKIVFDNTELNSLSREQMRQMRKRLQIIFQDPYSSLNPRITAGEAILEPMRVYKLHGSEKGRKKKAMALFEKVGLEPGRFNSYPHEFSGGQRQRICIARALAVEPEFIICDESVSALDVSVQAQVLNLLNDLKKEFRLTYIFISHDLSVVRYMSDRIAVMKDGKIIETGDADQVCTNPASEYTRKLIAAIPEL